VPKPRTAEKTDSLRVSPLTVANVEIIRESLPGALKKEHRNCFCLSGSHGCAPVPVSVKVSDVIYLRSRFLEIDSLVWTDDEIYQAIVLSVKEAPGVCMVWEPQTREAVSTTSLYWTTTLAVQTVGSSFLRGRSRQWALPTRLHLAHLDKAQL
jgi:hypothetical protein